ncbi:Hypothetical predicted protein [Paramuricea clavata]|uniref:Uncharacterized protein n=1 Tax=Paramuricea clavata TaxID=317549 RepID=A0A6S7GJC4_PARCT|nr:Hypothetical predicted protein [Paramuricea clavata]
MSQLRNDKTSDIQTTRAQWGHEQLDLNAQVESSENHVTRNNRYGKAALFFFVLLGLATGAGIGSKVPGVEKAIAILVGAVIGLIGFAVVGLFIYCIFKCRFEKQRDDRQNFQPSNLGDIALVDEMNGEKRRPG